MQIIVAGNGVVGRSLAERLAAETHDVVLIDREAGPLDEVQKLLDIRTVAGDAVEDSVLRRAGAGGDVWRAAFFQTANAVSTTGFYTADFAAWPALSRFILMAVMVVGASTGSSGGGIKTARLIVMLKAVGRDIRQAFRPHVVRAIRLDGQALSERVVHGALCFILVYGLVAGVSTLLLLADGHDITTNGTAVIACMNNFGTGLGEIGPTSNYTIYSPWSKLVLSLDMLLGRLEIFPLLVIFSPTTWRHYRMAAKRPGKA